MTTQMIKSVNFPTVVPLLLLGRTHTETSQRINTTRQSKGRYQDSNGSKAGNDMLVVTDLDKVLYDDVVN